MIIGQFKPTGFRRMQKTIFISDIHLEADTPHLTELFFQFLQSLDQTVDALYILGDLFEAWVGDDDNSSFNLKIIAGLNHTVKKGIPIYFIQGNRDFFINEDFAKKSGCQLLPDEIKIKLYDQFVLIMHGDTLCTHDKKYLFMRKIFRQPFLQKLFLSLPLSFRKKIGYQLRKKSKHHLINAQPDYLDVVEETVKNRMQQTQVCYLIHGHTHKPCLHIKNRTKKNEYRFVLGAWHEKGNMLTWYADGLKEWSQF